MFNKRGEGLNSDQKLLYPILDAIAGIIKNIQRGALFHVPEISWL